MAVSSQKEDPCTMAHSDFSAIQVFSNLYAACI